MPRVTKGLVWIGILAGIHQSSRFMDREYKEVFSHFFQILEDILKEVLV